jgi:hypothetical protein
VAVTNAILGITFYHFLKHIAMEKLTKKLPKMGEGMGHNGGAENKPPAIGPIPSAEKPMKTPTPGTKMPTADKAMKSAASSAKMPGADMSLKVTASGRLSVQPEKMPFFDMSAIKKPVGLKSDRTPGGAIGGARGAAMGEVSIGTGMPMPGALETVVGRAKAHVFERPGTHIARRIKELIGTQPVPAVGFDYPVTLRGSTANFTVYYNPSLGANGPIIADGVLASCEMEYAWLQEQFGGISCGPFNIIISPGIGGAYHYGCGAADLYCDADTSATPNIDHTRMLLVAEEVEVFSAVQGVGWNCGASNGEGLSRILATELYPAQLDGFTSAAYWLDASGRPDYVNRLFRIVHKLSALPIGLQLDKDRLCRRGYPGGDVYSTHGHDRWTRSVQSPFTGLLSGRHAIRSYR